MNSTTSLPESPRPELRERVASLKLPTYEPTSRGSKGLWFLVLLLLISNLVTLWWLKDRWQVSSQAQAANGVSSSAKSETIPASTSSPSGSSASTSTTTTASAPASAVVLESKGYITPIRQILVSPKVSGMITKLTFEEGMQVQKGDLLAVIESTEYEATRDRAAANLELAKHRLEELESGSRPDEIAQAEAELAEAHVNADEAERDYKRLADLAKVSATTDQAMTLGRSQFLAAKQRVARLTHALELLKEGPRIERINAAKAEVKQAEADLMAAEWRLGNCTIYAPVTGTILKKNAEEGNVVNPVAFNGSFSLCDLADLSDLEVQLDIQERDIRRVKVDQECQIRVDAFPDRKYSGYVSRLLPIADRAKGAVPVRVKIHVPPEEQGAFLKPEMGAIVTFLSSTTSSQTPEVQPPETTSPEQTTSVETVSLN